MPTYPYTLTVTNGGAETGDTTGWTNVTGTLVAIASGGGVTPRTGSFFFRSGASATTECYQDVSVPIDAESDVDAGKVKATFSAWQAGFTDTDTGRLRMIFRDGGGSTIATFDTTDLDGTSTWTQRTLSIWVPPTTRTIRLTLIGTRTTGTNLDAYWDDVTLELQQPMTGTAHSLAGCDLWLKASELTEDDGDPISTWEDASGVGNDVTGTTTTRPVYRETGTAGLNGLPTVEADGTDDVLAGGNALKYAGKAGLTVIAVLEHDPALGVTNGDIIARDGSGNRGFRLSINTDGRLFFQIATGATTRCQRDGSLLNLLGMPAIVRARFDGSTGEMSLWVNGVQDDGALDGTVPAAIANDGPALAVFGSGFSSRFKGDLGELLVFGQALSDSDCEAIEASLIADYALYVFTETATSPDLGAHQGHAYDGTYNYQTDTTSLQKRDASWSSVATNASPFSGLAGLDHMGDLAYHDGLLYVPAELEAGPFNAHILVFDADDLSRVDEHDISAQSFEPAALAIDTNRRRIWIGTFQSDPSTLWGYDLDTLAFIGTLALSAPIASLQGLSYHSDDDSLWATASGTDQPDGMVYRIDLDTGAVRPVYHRYVVGTGNTAEGVDFTQGSFRWLIDHNGIETVHVYTVVGSTPPAPTPSAGQVFRAMGFIG